MSESSARVNAIDALRDFRGRVIEFAEVTREAVSEADHEIRRTIDWLRNDMTSHWKREITLCNRKLESAKSELFRAELNAQQSGASTRDERARVTKLQHQIEHAEKKQVAIRKWVATLDREAAIYKGHTNSLSSAVTSDLPQACDELKVMAAQLDRYIQTTPTQSGSRQAESSADDADTSNEAESEKS